MLRSLARPAAALALALTACASSDTAGSGGRDTGGDDYLRFVAFTPPIRVPSVMRWQVEQMPLRVHLPPPPPGMFDDPDAIVAIVRRGVLDWTDVAAPGVPSFTFVDDAGRADVPVVWAPVAHGWWVAFAAYDLSVDSKFMRVNRILVAARYPDGTLASPEDLYLTMLHEMGHALGMMGHSPDPGDVMYEKGSWWAEELSERDRNTLRELYRRPLGSRIAGARDNW